MTEEFDGPWLYQWRTSHLLEGVSAMNIRFIETQHCKMCLKVKPVSYSCGDGGWVCSDCLPGWVTDTVPKTTSLLERLDQWREVAHKLAEELTYNMGAQARHPKYKEAMGAYHRVKEIEENEKWNDEKANN